MINLLDLDMHPTKIAFSLYVIRQFFKGPLNEIVFYERDEKFAVRKAKYVAIFKGKETQLEFWIIHSDKKAMGMAWRIIANDQINDYGMIHYELRPYSPPKVEQAIFDLPIQNTNL